MTIDINKLIESSEEFGADSVEYKLDFRKDGQLYRIKMTIETIDE